MNILSNIFVSFRCPLYSCHRCFQIFGCAGYCPWVLCLLEMFFDVLHYIIWAYFRNALLYGVTDWFALLLVLLLQLRLHLPSPRCRYVSLIVLSISQTVRLHISRPSRISVLFCNMKTDGYCKLLSLQSSDSLWSFHVVLCWVGS